jgi:hypothetical protein
LAETLPYQGIHAYWNQRKRPLASLAELIFGRENEKTGA